MNLDAILPFKGIGDILFGMTKAEIKKILGGNYEESVIEQNDDLSLNYKQLGLSFLLWDDEDQRLGYIGSVRDTCTLYGERLIGSGTERIWDFITSNLKTAGKKRLPQHKDGRIYNYIVNVDEYCIDVDEFGITFWLRDDVLFGIDWMVEYADSDIILWPE